MANNEEITLHVSENSPYVIGARAYVEQTENGAVITIIDKEGTTTATVSNGKGIASATLNEDYTLTLIYTDGTSVTTTSIRGEQGESGVYCGSEEPDNPDVDVWIDPTGDPYPMEDEIADAVDEWITAHPEYVTTVQDGAITVPKFAAGVVDTALNKVGYPAESKATGDAIAADRTRLTAVEGEADALDARITNLAQLTDGSTTGDAELMDARVVGSTTYSTLHEAIDTEFTNVKSAITHIDGFLGISSRGEEESVKGYNANNSSSAVSGNAPFVYSTSNYDYTKRVITKIKLKVLTAGTLSIGVIKKNNAVSGSSANRSNAAVKEVMNIPSSGEQVITLSTPFTVKSDEYLFIGMDTDTCVFAYGTNGIDKGFLYFTSNSWAYSTGSLGVTVYTIPNNPPNYEAVLSDVNQSSNITDVMQSDLYSDVSFCNGYDASNTSPSYATTAPFMVNSNADGWVFSFKLKIHTAGNLTIGTIQKSDVVWGQTFDFSKVNVHEVTTFEDTGEQTYQLKAPMRVTLDDLIVLTVRSDTARFCYGNGIDKGFYYVNDTTVDQSSSSLGISFYGISISVAAGSSYNGKTLSILGDSISTFSGYIPEGNLTYYPSGTVQAVSDTWWYKLYTALGMTLNVNNSWSGSKVTTTAGETSAGCMTRCQSLGTNPDVIIVWMGINDFNGEVALGTYDGTTALPSVTTTFREAYAIMLNKILTTYQSAEVWVCTLPQCERNAETGFPEINGNGVALAEFNKAILELANAFGVKVLDHNKCGLTYQNMPTFNPDNLHPNKYGHSLVANNDIRQIDNFVRTRYPIA